MEREALQNKFGVDNFSKIVDRPYPFLINGDLSRVSKRVVPNLNGEVDSLQDELYGILEKNMPEGASFYTTSTDYLNTRVEERIKMEIDNNYKKIGVVSLDRYFCANIPEEYKYKINVSRNIEGGLVARPGETESPDMQIQKLILWSKAGNFKELVLVDDVLAFADTTIPLIKRLKDEMPEINVRVLVGIASSGGVWSGIEKVNKETGIVPEFIILAKASPETANSSGMALPTSRDFTFLGGKISRSENAAISFPYFIPFSIPVVSFMPKEKRIDAARELIKLNIKLAKNLSNVLGRDLKISDLTSSGFGIPYTKIKCLKEIMKFPTPELAVAKYLEYARLVMENNMDNIVKESMET